MKKIILIITFLTVLMCSCSTYTSISNQNGFTTSELNFKLDSGYSFEFIDWLDESNLFIVLENMTVENDETKEKKKIYIHNIADNTRKLIYEGEFYGDYTTDDIKIVDNGELVFKSSDTLLFFDLENLKLQNEVKFNDIYAPELLSDGKRIVYKYPEGIFLSQVNDPNKAITIEEKKQNHLEIFEPKVSLEDKILYTTISANNAEVNIFDADTNETKIIKMFKEETTVAREYGINYWFPNNKRILVHFGIPSETLSSIVSIVNLEGDVSKEIKFVNYITILDLMNNNILLSDNGANNKVLKLYTIDNGKETQITPPYLDITCSKFSKNGDSIAFIGIQENLGQGLYITKQDK